MTSITVPAGVVSLLYSGLQLHIRDHILPELDELYRKPGRKEHPKWFTQPYRRLSIALELLLIIDWPRDRPVPEVDIEIDLFGDTLRSGFAAELLAQRNHFVAQVAGPELRAAKQAIRLIEGFLAGLPLTEAGARVQAKVATDLPSIEGRILSLLLREDRDERISGELVQASCCARRLHALETVVAYRASRGEPSGHSEGSR
jgi:hypothetical protein